MSENYYPEAGVRLFGVSSTMFDYTELMDAKPERHGACCTSFVCSGSRAGKGIYKPNAKRNQSECPDCGHVLVWRRLRAANIESLHNECDE